MEKLNSQESAANFRTASENNFHLEKLMPGVLHSKPKRYSSDRRLEKVRASVKKISTEINSQNTSCKCARHLDHCSMLKRAPLEEDVPSNLCDIVNKSEVKTDSKIYNILFYNVIKYRMKENCTVLLVYILNIYNTWKIKITYLLYS